MKATVPANLRRKCDAVGISQNAARVGDDGSGEPSPALRLDSKLTIVAGGWRDAPGSPLLEASGLLARTSLVGGDFFRCIPRGAHLYVLKSVIHDWDDEQAQRILAGVVSARAAGTARCWEQQVSA